MAYWEPGGPRDKRFASSEGGSRVPPRPDGAKPGFKLAGRSTGRGRVPKNTHGPKKL